MHVLPKVMLCNPPDKKARLRECQSRGSAKNRVLYFLYREENTRVQRKSQKVLSVIVMGTRINLFNKRILLGDQGSSTSAETAVFP